MSGNEPYMVIFQDDAKKQDIDNEVSKVESGGGKVTRRFDSDIMKGFAAELPLNFVTAYSNLTAGGKDATIAYIEPDQKVSTMGSG